MEDPLERHAEDLEQLVEDFARAALRARRAGGPGLLVPLLLFAITVFLSVLGFGIGKI